MQSIQVSGPSRQISAAELEENTMTGGDYEVIKLVKPQVGQWNLDLSGTPGSRVTVNVVYNADSVAELATADGKSEYNTGESVTFQAYLKKDGSRVTDSSVLGEYKAVLHLSNLTDGTTQDIDMTPDADGMFVYEFRTNQESSYSAYATLEFGSLVHQSGDAAVNFGNTPPTAVGGVTLVEEKVVVTPVSGRHRSFKLGEYFSDTPGDTLHYVIVSSQLVSDTAAIDGDTLNVETSKSRSGDLERNAPAVEGGTEGGQPGSFLCRYVAEPCQLSGQAQAELFYGRTLRPECGPVLVCHQARQTAEVLLQDSVLRQWNGTEGDRCLCGNDADLCRRKESHRYPH